MYSSVLADVDSDGDYDFNLSISFDGYYSNLFKAVGSNGLTPIAGNNFFAGVLNPGVAIPGVLSKSSSASILTSASNSINNSVTQLYGFEFLSGTSTLFGWADISFVFNGSSSSLTINNWCYENEVDSNNIGLSIDAGVCNVASANVPEPPIASLLLLGLGAAGVRRWREQKRLRDAS